MMRALQAPAYCQHGARIHEPTCERDDLFLVQIGDLRSPGSIFALAVHAAVEIGEEPL